MCDHDATNWITDNINSRIATATGSFQSELGCAGDWDPGCLRSWLQDVDGDGIYRFTTTDLPPGDYEWKVAVNEAWDENYGAGGAPGGANIGFTVGSGDEVTFSWDTATNIPTVTVASPDSDDDGVADDVDNCTATPNVDQANFDGDALGDACDPDDDNDGVADGDDAFPLDPSESSDSDGDGLGDNADPDDDNDGQSDADEAACGSDPTNAASMSTDSDGDHVPLDDDLNLLRSLRHLRAQTSWAALRLRISCSSRCIDSDGDWIDRFTATELPTDGDNDWQVAYEAWDEPTALASAHGSNATATVLTSMMTTNRRPFTIYLRYLISPPSPWFPPRIEMQRGPNSPRNRLGTLNRSTQLRIGVADAADTVGAPRLDLAGDTAPGHH